MSASRQASLVVLLSIAACAARVTQPASAQAAAPQKPARRSVVSRAPAPIGAQSVDRVGKLWEVAAGGRARAVAIERVLGQVAYFGGSRVALHELARGRRTTTVSSCQDVLRGGLAYHARRLFVVCERGVEVFEGGKRVRPPFQVSSAPITAGVLSGERLALAHDDGVIRIHGLDGSPSMEIKVPGPPVAVKSLGLTADGKRIAVAWVQGSIWWWDTSRPDEPQQLVRHPSESDSCAFSDDGQWFAEEGEPSFTTVWNVGEAPAPRARVRNGAWVKRLLFTRDGRWLVRGGSDGLELAEIDGPKRIALDTRGAVEDVALDDRGALMASADRDGRLALWGVGAPRAPLSAPNTEPK